MRINDLVVSYDNVKIIDGLNLELKDGVTCIMGDSGCGKTTLLNVIAGLVQPDAGSIEGRPARISFMFQEDRLFPWMNALDNISVVCNDKEKAASLLKAVELEEDWDKMPEELSGGMKRRVALARTLAYPADLIILDEPFKGLDHELMKRMIELIKKENTPILMATHSEEEAELLGAEVLRL